MMPSKRIPLLTFFGTGLLAPAPALAHLVNADVGGFYAGMLHPLTSAEHLLPMAALALLAGQGGKRAGRLALGLFPVSLALGILAGRLWPLAAFFHGANLALLMVLGLLVMVDRGRAPAVAAVAAMATGAILGWRSGADWAASNVGFQFVPGVALTGFLLMTLIAAWVPPASNRVLRMLRTAAGSGFFLAGALLSVQWLAGPGAAMGRAVGMPTEEGLKALVTAPRLSLAVTIGACAAAMLWGAAHALTPGHGKAIVAAYLVGARGTPAHALYLGLTVTLTHTLVVFIMGLAAAAAAQFVAPERLHPWLGLLSGMMVCLLGAIMFVRRAHGFGATREGGDHGHHDHHHHHGDHGHDHPHAHHHHHPIHPPSHEDLDHSHDYADAPCVHSHGGHSHSHLPPGADGRPVTWRSLLALGVGAGLLPCPSAMVLLLTALALQRIALGLLLVAAFSTGLAAVLILVGLLFIKGSRLLGQTPSLAIAGRWVPVAGALVICVLGGGIVWESIANIVG